MKIPLTSQRFPLVPGKHEHEKPLADASGTHTPLFLQVSNPQAESCELRNKNGIM